MNGERKWRRVLRALIEKPSVHRMTAERDLAIRDHCLPSTIAELQQRGLRIDREMIELPGYDGGVARVANYSLDSENRKRAQRLLGDA